MQYFRGRWFVVVWLFLGVVVSQSKAGENTEYRFERMVPKLLEQQNYFHAPMGIAVAPDGSIWVADTGKHRIQHIRADGNFIGSLGNGTVGNNNGEFNSPRGVAVSPDGTVWVADSANNRLQHFNAAGAFLGRFGSKGVAAGQFDYPNHLAVAADGSLWVTDTSNSRIQHLTPNGNQISQFYEKNSFFSGIAVAPDSSIWATSTYGLTHVSATGNLLGHFGSVGFGNDQLKDPYGLAVAADGSLWVANTGNHRIEHYSKEGKLIFSLGSKGSKAGQFARPFGVALGVDSSLWVADTDNGRVQHLTTTGVPLAQFESQGSLPGQFASPVGIDTAPDHSVWVADSGNHRIQHFSATGEPLNQFGEKGTIAGQLMTPTDIAVALDGSLWVADSGNSRIQHFNASGTLLGQVGSKGSGAGQFSSPTRIAIAPDASLWVLDLGNNRVQHISANGAFIGQISDYVESIDVAADGSLWATINDYVKHYSPTGTLLTKFGGYGNSPWYFWGLSDITVASDGSLWVTDAINYNVQHLSSTGKPLDKFGNIGTAANQFDAPTSISVDRDGSVWVTELSNNRIQKFVPRSKSASFHAYKAIILAGGGETLGNNANNIWDGTWRIAQKAYRALNLQGFTVHEEMKFLTAGSIRFDLDNNNQFDDLELATKDSLKNAITVWAKDANDVVIYLADHGGPGKFQVNSTEIMSADELNNWVSTLQKQIPGKVTLIVEACNSGSFMDYLKSPKRYVLTSAKSDQAAVISNGGLNSFSYTFWSEIATNGGNVQSAFKSARQAMSATKIGSVAIDAQNDSNGDGIFTINDDYAALGDYCLGNCNLTTAGVAPTIQPINPNKLTLNNTVTLDLSIQVDHLQPLSDVWALVQRPDDPIADSSIPLKFEKVALDCNKQDQCTGKYTRFDTQGEYRLQFYAMDSNFEISLPETLTVTQTQGKAAPTSISTVKPSQPASQASGKYPVEYDDSNQLLHLVDVVVNGQDFQADLQLQGGQFVLIPSSVKAIEGIFLQSAKFDAVNGFLTIPLARAFGKDYTAKLKHQGNYKFSIESASPK